jgi:hypothetical protein
MDGQTLTGQQAENALNTYMTLGSSRATFNARRVETALRAGKHMRMLIRPIRFVRAAVSSRPAVKRSPRKTQRRTNGARKRAKPHLPRGS